MTVNARSHAPLKRKKIKTRARIFETYDLETTLIEKGTPIPLYITMSQDTITLSQPLSNLEDLYNVLIGNFLIIEKVGWRFIAHYGNNFDFILLSKALIEYDDGTFRIEPYLTKSGKLRGACISRKIEKKTVRWYFSDSMAMTGSIDSLKKFLTAFAPDYPKETIDVLHFDNTNPVHIQYAERDAIGLWHAMKNIEKIYNSMGVQLENTVAKAAVKLFMSYIPEEVLIWELPYSLEKPIRKSGVRGGYVHAAKKTYDPIWKYDINQAYADAMREAKLPCGRCIHTRKYVQNKVGCYLVEISRNEQFPIPFIVKTENGRHTKTSGDSVTAWIFDIEIQFLLDHNWNLNIIEGWYWTDSFSMKELVDLLEYNRINSPGGPKGAQGMVMKAFGNNAYGKTLEEHDGTRMICSKIKPEMSFSYQPETPDFDNWWLTKEEVKTELYHRPQIGAVITTFVRMKIMRTIMIDPEHYIMSDTDMVCFSRPVPQIELDYNTYGKFKPEVEGEYFYIIAMKTYFSEKAIYNENGMLVPETIHTKGLNPKKISYDEMLAWYHGTIPSQTQIQRIAFLRTVGGSDMFREVTKRAEKKNGQEVTQEFQPQISSYG